MFISILFECENFINLKQFSSTFFFLNNQDYAAMGFFGGKAIVYNWRTKTIVNNFDSGFNQIPDVKILENGFLFAHLTDNFIVWDVSDNQSAILNVSVSCYHIELMENQKLACASSNEKKIHIFSLNSGLVKSIELPDFSVYVKALTNENYLASVNTNGKLSVWNVVAGLLNHTIDANKTTSLEIVPDNQDLLMSINMDEFVRVYKISDGSLMSTYDFNANLWTGLAVYGHDVVALWSFDFNSILFLRINSLTGILTLIETFYLSAGSVGVSALAFTQSNEMLALTNLGLDFFHLNNTEAFDHISMYPDDIPFNINIYSNLFSEKFIILLEVKIRHQNKVRLFLSKFRKQSY